MTHPLTPREKMAEIVRNGMNRLAASQAGARPVVSASKEADRVTDAILTALASGSGDHAELARLAESLRRGKVSQGDRVRVATLSEALLAENAALRSACSKSNDEISQTLGKALGYPWFKDDQINFPGATAENGVCVGDHVAESLADEAARRITEAERKLAEAVGMLRQASSELESEVEARYDGIKDHPAMTPKYERDMDTPQRINAWLSKEAERG